MKEPVAKISPETIDELKFVIIAVWGSLEQALIDNLVNSFLQFYAGLIFVCVFFFEFATHSSNAIFLRIFSIK